MNNTLKIVFMGTPDFSADVLKRISDNESVDVVAVYTQPDAIRGRGNKLVSSPVKVIAENLGYHVETSYNFKEDNDVQKLASFNPDFIVVAAYGVILPKSVLDTPKYECLNIHGSLLPRWRGAAPVQRAILEGDKESGISIMKMDIGMDTGDYCNQVSFLLEDMYCDEVFDKMAECGTEELFKTMDYVVGGSQKWNVQDEQKVTIAHKISKKELWLDKSDSCTLAYRKVLASDDNHVCKCNIYGKNVRIVKANILNPQDNKTIYLKFKDGYLGVRQLKPDGKNIQDSKSFLSGLQNNKTNILEWGPVL